MQTPTTDEPQPEPKEGSEARLRLVLANLAVQLQAHYDLLQTACDMAVSPAMMPAARYVSGLAKGAMAAAEALMDVALVTGDAIKLPVIQQPPRLPKRALDPSPLLHALVAVRHIECTRDFSELALFCHAGGAHSDLAPLVSQLQAHQQQSRSDLDGHIANLEQSVLAALDPPC